MLKRVLLLTTSAFLLACGAIGASAQQGPTTQQPQIQQQQSERERQLQSTQTPRRAVQDDIEDDGGMMGWHYGPGWGRGWGPGMGMMGRGSWEDAWRQCSLPSWTATVTGPFPCWNFRRPTSASSRQWTPIKMAALPWRKSKPSCKEPGDQFRSSRTNRSPNFTSSVP